VQGTNDCFVFTNVDGHPIICRPTGNLCFLIYLIFIISWKHDVLDFCRSLISSHFSSYCTSSLIGNSVIMWIPLIIMSILKRGSSKLMQVLITISRFAHRNIWQWEVGVTLLFIWMRTCNLSFSFTFWLLFFSKDTMLICIPSGCFFVDVQRDNNKKTSGGSR
jgi:hypothetical protein